MKANAKLPIYVSPVPEPMMWKQDDFQHSLDNLNPLAPKWRRKRLSRLSPVCPSNVENVSGEKIILNAP